MARRSYDDPCGLARALDLVGERWALLLVRELLLGPKRFADLRRGLPAASPNVLSHRLRELEQAGVVRRRRLGPPASTTGYELTERGRDLESALLALARWGSRTPLPPGGELSVDALLLALRTTFDPIAAGDLRARFELRLGDDLVQVAVGGGELQVQRGGGSPQEVQRGGEPEVTLPGGPDAVISADATTLRALVFGREPIETAEQRGALRISGDRAMVARFVTLFPRPAPFQAMA